MMKHRCLLFILGLLPLGLLIPLVCLPLWKARAQESLPPGQAEIPGHVEILESTASDWLEPSGLNIVDLVGLVPEEYLKEMIISYTPGYGILTYESGTREGSTVTITATVYPRYIQSIDWGGSLFGCLGQPARIDQWGSVAPATTMRLYRQGEDVTDEVDLFTYVPAGLHQPIRNPQESERVNQYRYSETGLRFTKDGWFTPDGALSLPTNMGCELIVSYRNYEQLTAVFVTKVQKQISVEVMGTEEFTFRSYMGPGYAGVIEPLVSQLHDKYGGRHDKFSLDIPVEADYFLLNFPAMPVDPYTLFNKSINAGRPTGGTYRVDGSGLCVDHVNSMGLPLYGHWNDMDLVKSGTTYLPHFETPNRLASPEYFVPAGVEYDPCMLQGNCPDWLLEDIRNTEMTMTIIYLHVERTGCRMTRIPLEMVGPAWNPSTTALVQPAGEIESYWEESLSPVSLSSTSALSHSIYLPLISNDYCNHIPPDDPTGCPCGWFTQDGRMMDFIP